MKKYYYIKLFSIHLLFFVYCFGQSKPFRNELLKQNLNRQSYRLNINRISTIFHNDGRSDIDGDASFFYPKGSDKSCFYESGFLWIGKINGKIHMGGSTFPSGLVPGKLNEDPETARMYRVRPDWKTADFKSEIADGEGTFQEIKDKYKYDWNNWPAEDGAPFKDIDNDGIYNSEVDIPGVPESDQTIFFITNSSDKRKSESFFGMPPTKTEIHITLWAYNIPGPMGNMVFRKYEIKNLGEKDIDSCYFGMWSDTDLGNAGDDYIGCDSTLDLGYVYNALPEDRIYGSYPPAAGFTILQGAKVYSDSLAQYSGLTAFSFYVNYPKPWWYEPDLDDYRTWAPRYWNSFKGGGLWDFKFYLLPDFLGGGRTIFPLSGDPVTGKGFIDGLFDPPMDRRFLMPSGPTTIKVGEKQEFIVAQIAAGGLKGINNLEAITELKKYASQAKAFYDQGFELMTPTNNPIVSVTELDEKLILNWNDKDGIVNEIENFDRGNYTFQGYKIYQFPKINSPKEEGVLLASLDKIDGIKRIVEEHYRKKIETITDTVVQIGKDNGSQRYFVIERDSLRSTNLFNGSEYYFGVSAYTYCSDEKISPRSMESEITRLTAIPQSKSPGSFYEKEFDEKINVTKTSGTSDGEIEVIVMEPNNVTGDEYEINFSKLENLKVVWNFWNKTKKKKLISENENQTGNNEYSIVEGMLVKVKNNIGVKLAEQTIGEEILTPGTTNKINLEAFNGSIGYASPNNYYSKNKMEVKPDSLKPVLLKFAKVDDTNNYDPHFDINDPDMSFGYRYIDLPMEQKSDKIKMAQKNYDFESFEKNIPLSAWDISNPENPRRLALGFLETNNNNLSVDGKYWPSNYSEEDLFIFDAEYSETSNPVLEKKH